MAKKSFLAVAAVILAFLVLGINDAAADAGSPPPLVTPNSQRSTVEKIYSGIKNYFFPRIEITLFNEGDHDILYTCTYTENDTNLYPLRKGEKFTYNFTQIAFPMRWCYLYVNDKINGFFWSYNVRLRCTKCFWSIDKYPFLYRSDRTRWERQELFMPRDFDITRYKKSPNANPMIANAPSPSSSSS